MANLSSIPTLEDVADAAGVSTATVSRCLNTPGKVAETTRRKVFEAVEKLDYSPNFGARAMAAKRTYTIGAIIPTMENAIFARGLQAFQEELRDHGYHLLVASTSYNAQTEADLVRAMVARGAEGLLLIGQDRSEPTINFLKQRNLATLVAWTFDPDGSFPTVGFDNHAAMRILTEKVIAMGHKNIGMISAKTANNDRARARVNGIRDAIAAANLPGLNLSVIETVYTIDAGARAFEALMAETARPTVVLCGNDVLAVGAVKKAKALGIDVPGHVSITGFDDMELATVIEPALTTVHVPHRDMGQEAAKVLIKMIEDPDKPPNRRLLETHIVFRDSLADLAI